MPSGPITPKSAAANGIPRVRFLAQRARKSALPTADIQIENLKSAVSVSQKMLSNASKFIYDSLGDSPELKIFSTDITRNDLSAQFLIGFGCDDFSEITKTTKSDKELLSELDKIL